MLKTVLFLLCSVTILVSGANDTTPHSIVTSTEPSTTSAPHNNTTPAPTPAPAPITTPAPPPKPVPPPETGKWLVNGTNQTCIIVQMALQFNVTYTTKENKTAHQVLNLPGSNESSAQGTCGTAADLEQDITLSWNTVNTSAIQNTLTLHFVKNTTNNQYALHHLELSLAPDELPQIGTNDSTSYVHASDQFTTGINNSYRCLKQQTLSLNTTADNKPAGNITVSNLQFQAFHTESSTTFGFAEDCAFDTPDIVPIAVGCALALLVVIVLIAYLAGRRRSQARGYLSM